MPKKLVPQEVLTGDVTNNLTVWSMLELSRISITVFSYVTEENERVVQSLRNCMPQQLRTTGITRIGTQSQFGDPLIIYAFETDKKEDVDAIVSFLAEHLDLESKEYLSRHFERKIDLETRALYFRIDKFKAYLEDLSIIEGSDVIKIELGYNAYTKTQNDPDHVRNLLQSTGLLA